MGTSYMNPVQALNVARLHLAVLGGRGERFGMCKIFRSTFAGWALTEGQHRPKAGKKKKTREADLFFSGSRFILDVPSGSGYNRLFPAQ